MVPSARTPLGNSLTLSQSMEKRFMCGKVIQTEGPHNQLCDLDKLKCEPDTDCPAPAVKTPNSELIMCKLLSSKPSLSIPQQSAAVKVYASQNVLESYYISKKTLNDIKIPHTGNTESLDQCI